jgi:hypothetical protein
MRPDQNVFEPLAPRDPITAKTARARDTGPTVVRRSRRSRRWVRVAVYAGVLTATVGGVIYATRDDRAADVSPAGHAHGAAAPSGKAAQSVTLTADDARRIGVTYAPVTVGAFGKEVRTVAQVTLDETTVKSISPKIDGWVERLFVSATGQYVGRGQPLLTIYAPMLVTAQEELLLAKRLQGDVAGAGDATRASANSLLASARRRLAYWDIPSSEIAEIERSGEVRKILTLRAPASGYVLEKNVLAGQKIMAGEAL